MFTRVKYPRLLKIWIESSGSPTLWPALLWSLFIHGLAITFLLILVDKLPSVELTSESSRISAVLVANEPTGQIITKKGTTEKRVSVAEENRIDEGTNLATEQSISEYSQEPVQKESLTPQANPKKLDEVMIATESLLVELGSDTHSTFEHLSTQQEVNSIRSPGPPSNLSPEVTKISEVASKNRQLSFNQSDSIRSKMKQIKRNLPKMMKQGKVKRWSDGEQDYRAQVSHTIASSGTELDKVVVEIETKIEGELVSTSINYKRLALSSYAQIINRWDPEVLLSDDIIEGRFHANSEILINESRRQWPRFEGKVSTTSTVSGSRGRRDRIFQGGLQQRAKRIQFPDRLMPNTLHDTSEIQTDHFEQDAHIVFHETGYYWYIPSDPDNITEVKTQANVLQISGGAGVTLNIQGTIKNTVLVYAAHKIRITGDLLYSRDPKIFFNSEDFLGILSNRYVEVASPEVTGAGDLIIQATVYAKRRFQVRKYRHAENAKLSIYGNLIAGTVSATEPRYGTIVEFDKRFEDRRLLGFPMTNNYEIDTWEASWKQKKASHQPQ